MPVFFRDSSNISAGRSRGASYAHAKVENLPKLLKMLDTNTILAQGGWRAGMTEATRYLFSTLQKRTPVGRTRSILKAERWEVQQVGVPRWGRVEIPTLPTRRGFRYGGALEGSRRIPYQYRAGVYAKRTTKSGRTIAARLTFHWWSGARGAAQRGINRIFERLNEKIQQGWDRAA